MQAQAHRLMRDRAAGLAPASAALLQRASAALDAQDLQAAEVALAEVLTTAPACAEALRMQGLVRHLRGDFAAAVTLLEQACALCPDDALIQMNLATARYAGGDCDAALAGLQRACAMTPDFAPAWYNLGKMYMLQERAAGAVTALHRALDVEPGHVPARMLLAQAQAGLGATGPASDNYREVLRLEPDQPSAWLGLADLDAASFSIDDLTRLQHALQAPQLDARARICLGFALTRALEDQADYRAAFQALRKANGLMQRQFGWNATQASAWTRTVGRHFAEPIRVARDDTAAAPHVIFIVGMPQAGSLLTAQILASHADVAVADEPGTLEQIIDAESIRRQQPFPQWTRAATPADWLRLGRDYLARIEPLRQGKPCFVDRSPGHWRLVGALLAMLPGARVVDSRRDALETCFACYRQLFVSGHEFSYRLDHVASYWHDYERLCRHWRRLYPASVLAHDYEAWQADPEPSVRRLLDFCGLEFDRACTDFHASQHVKRAASRVAVGELMRQGSLRCAAYDSQLGHLRALLRASPVAD
ncbi:MAG TPA: sulfotransferase [Rhodanobacter sp.]|nr:sulfotransferase [Rhodanobacter sp.]